MAKEYYMVMVTKYEETDGGIITNNYPFSGKKHQTEAAADAEEVEAFFSTLDDEETKRVFVKKFPEPEKIIGAYPLCNFGGLVILSINYGINDTITSGFSYGDGIQNRRTTKIHYTASGRDYITRYGRRYYLDEIQRV